MRIITSFNKNLWEKLGQSWRRPNIQALDPIIFYSKEMSEESKKEITDFFNSTYEVDIKFYELCNFFLSNILEEGKNYLITSPEHVPPFEISVNRDVLLSVKNVSLDERVELSKSIFTIPARVDAVNILSSIVEKQEGLFDASFIAGTADFWVGFIGFQNLLKESNYIRVPVSGYADIVLNLFCNLSSSFSVEIKK